MARPRKAPDERRSEKIEGRVTPQEKLGFLEQCEAAGMTEAEFVRRRCLGYQVPPARPLVDQRLLRELNAIGNNVNQLTFAMHTDRAFMEAWGPIAEQLAAVLDKIAEEL